MHSRWLPAASTPLAFVLATSLALGADPFPPGVLAQLVPPTHRGSTPVTGLAMSRDGRHVLAIVGNASRQVWPLEPNQNGRPDDEHVSISNRRAFSSDRKFTAWG